MKPRWALVVMGAWLMGSICMSMVATENFYTIDRLLAGSPNAAFASMVQKLGQPAARELLRYLSSELNRLYFRMWNVAQIALGVAALWLVRSRRAGTFGAAAKVIVAMLAIVVLMLVYLTPAIVSLGRELDFVPRDPPPPGMSRFWVLHAAYTSLEMLKLAAGVLAAGLIARRSS
jgi:glycerol-3-phosphate acyltransferase PlsY